LRVIGARGGVRATPHRRWAQTAIEVC